MKKIVLLGSTGSIGKSVLDIVQKQTSFFSICGLSCYQNTAELFGFWFRAASCKVKKKTIQRYGWFR